MSKHNSKVLKVYQQCETVLKLKREFVEQIYVPSLPSIDTPKQISGVKDFCTAHYVQIAVTNFFKEAGENYGRYKNQLSSKKAIQGQIQFSIRKIKNTKQLTSKHEQLESELDQLKKRWEKEETLVYYQVNERSKFKTLFTQKLNQFKQSQSGIKTIKNPHFVHQLINQLKQNLQKISELDKQYDVESEQSTQKICKYLKELTKQMLVNIDQIKYRSFIFQQKKKLFSQFVDIQDINSRNFRASRYSNSVKSYFQQLILVSKDIKQHFKRLIQFVDGLIVYFKKVQGILKQQARSYEKKYQNFIEQVFKNKQIRVILHIDVQQRINNNLKAIFSISQIIMALPNWLYNCRNSLIQCYNQANNYHERYITKQIKFKDSTDSFQKMLIEHKGYFGSLQKKEQKQNYINIETLRRFARDLHEMMRMTYLQNVKQPRYTGDVDVHQMLNKIFAEYNFNEESNQTQESGGNKDECVRAKTIVYDKFVESIQQFEISRISWSGCYYSCSLGPKLLLHGYLQILQEGIYYQSSFNKKNLFFGKTRLFIPKADIYQVNKQIVLLLFADVIQIKTNRGNIYFHALGKRDSMYQQLINVYFPQVQDSQNGIDGELEYEFNQFKGQDTKDRTAYKIKPLPIDLGQSTLKNGDLRVIFRRYLSDDSFTYQGKQHQNFKCYQLQYVGGISASSNQLTPPPPYYFMRKGEPVESQTVPQFSIRLATFEKKIPLIPFISKGGNALCQQKSTYYWGSPDFFVVQIQNIMKGFSLTQGMTIKIKCIYRQDPQKNQVKCSTSAEIVFLKQGALAGTIRNQALAQLKAVIRKTTEVMQKNEQNRSVYKNKGNNLQRPDQQKEQYKDQIQKLKHQNTNLNKKMKIMFALFILLYLFTIVAIKMASSPENNQQKSHFQDDSLAKHSNTQKQKRFWSFL